MLPYPKMAWFFGQAAMPALAIQKPTWLSSNLAAFLFDQLTPENLVIVDLEGQVVEGNLKPSVDTASHLYVYRHRPDVHGVVHTHSPYATSFAIRGESLPIYTTTAAAVFRRRNPGFRLCHHWRRRNWCRNCGKIGACAAILMRSHGVFTIGKDVMSALKNAVILEETAQYVHYAKLRGPIDPLPDEVVRAGYEVYHTNYGQ